MGWCLPKEGAKMLHFEAFSNLKIFTSLKAKQKLRLDSQAQQQVTATYMESC